MGFFTRITLEDNAAKQLSGTSLTLSGETNFFGILKSKGVEIDASTGGTFAGYGLILDTDGVIRLKPFSGGTGSGLYDGASPSTISVGGIPAGFTLTGKTYDQLWEKLLVVYQEPTFTSFNINIPSLFEVGDPSLIAGAKVFTWSTSNSSNVEPNTVEIIDITDSALIATGLANDGVEAIALPTPINNNIPIVRTWRIEGENTEGDDFNRNRTVESIYPWFYGTFDAGAVAVGVGRPDLTGGTVAQDLIDDSNKIIAKSNGTITVPDFNSSSQDYIWFAIPADVNQNSTPKTVWFVNALNNGTIGGVISAGGNLFPDGVVVAVDEPSNGFWTGVNYRFYLSNKQVAVNNMEFRNS